MVARLGAAPPVTDDATRRTVNMHIAGRSQIAPDENNLLQAANIEPRANQETQKSVRRPRHIHRGFPHRTRKCKRTPRTPPIRFRIRVPVIVQAGEHHEADHAVRRQGYTLRNRTLSRLSYAEAAPSCERQWLPAFSTVDVAGLRHGTTTTLVHARPTEPAQCSSLRAVWCATPHGY